MGEIDIGLPVGVDGADVAPIGLALEVGPDAGMGEAVGHRFAVFDDIGNDVLAEVAARFGISGIPTQHVHQEFRVNT